MKKIILLIIAISLSGCDLFVIQSLWSAGLDTVPGNGGNGYSNGDSIIVELGSGLSLVAIYNEGGTFPIEVDDSDSAAASAFWIGESEVTYELWETVRIWAISNGYTFANGGMMGYGGGTDNQHPVAQVSWRSAMVWCNALTEYVNSVSGSNLACVYTSDSSFQNPIRTSTSVNSVSTVIGSEDQPYVNPNSKGYRLPTKNEWECAAR